MGSKRDAVNEIHKSATTAHVAEAARAALKDGSDAALTRALVTAREDGVTAHVVETANKALGFEK